MDRCCSWANRVKVRDARCRRGVVQYVFRVKPELDNFTWSLGSEPYSLMSTQVTYFLRDSRLEKLPTHILHIVAEFAMDLNWRKSSKRVGSGDYESSERLVLQPSAGAFALICKTCRAAYSHLIWRSHPNSVTVYAWENKCRLLFKSKIESVKVLVRYDSVSEDVNKFQTLLLGSSPSMAECCPSIKNFKFSVTLTGIDEGHLLSLKEKIGKDFRYFNASSGLDWEISYHMDMLKKAKTIDDISIFYFVHPNVSWSLAALGTTVQGFKLSLSQLPIPDLMRGVDELAVHQVMDIRVANGKALRSSTIKSFHTDLYGLEGCAISNNFNHACYALLPATLEEFSLGGGGGNFEIPFAFPPTLQELSLSGVPFSSNKLGLPKNSNIKVVKLSLGFLGAEDSPDFKFKSLDVSDLPDSIEVFEIEGDFPLSGKFSTSSRLKSLVIRSREDGKIDFDALPPTLEELHLAVDDVWGKPATATTAGSLSRSRFPVLRAIKSESQDILNLLKSKAKEMIGLHFVKLENER